MKILRESDPTFKTLGRIRQSIIDARDQILAVNRASLCTDDIRERIAIMINAKLAKSVSSLGTIAYRPRADRTNPEFPDCDWRVLVTILGRDVVEARLLEATLHEMKAKGVEPGLPLSERGARIAQIEADIRSAEIAEIREMVRLEEAGWIVLPRRDADVRLMLEIWGELGGPPEVDISAASSLPKRTPHINDGAALHAPVGGLG